MKKKVLSTLLVGAMAASLFAGCTGNKTTTTAGGNNNNVERPTMAEYGSGTIKIWTADACVELTQKAANDFIAAHPEYAGYKVEVTATGENVAADNVINDLDAAADIYGFPQDQLSRLVNAGALAQFGTFYANSVATSNDAGSVQAAQMGAETYAFPYTSDNGYYLYYDKNVISDPTNLEKMIEECEAAEKNFYFDLGNGWYQTSFFFATGCELTYDTNDKGEFTKCNISYNSDAGLVALKEMSDMSESPFFVGGSEADQANNVGFMVVGVWADETMHTLLGDGYAVAKLPKFTGSDGKEYQLSGFGGFKLMGVKPQEDPAKQMVCFHLAEYLTGKDVQLQRFKAAGFGPSNLEAQQDSEVQANEALAALGAQLAHTIPQGQYPGDYWSRAGALFNDIKDAGLTDDELKAQLAKFQADCESYCNAE